MMLILLLFSVVLYYGDCADSETFDLKVRYLEDLVNKEVKKAETYKWRTNNKDLLDNAANLKPVDFGAYDFIIVGSGSAGSIVANRLTENPKWKVLVLEAGDVNDEFTDMPFTFVTSGLSERNWGYLTVGQNNGCQGRDWNQCPYPRGKILGGTGSINGLFYSRGIRADYNSWSNAGNPGWSWNEVLPYFKKLENFESATADLNYRGTKGPVNVGYMKPESIPQKAFLQANKEIGIRILDDYNAANINGASWLQHNIHNGKRVSGANNYVRPAWNRTNFKLELNAFVIKIEIDTKTRDATGVVFIKNNVKYIANATKEVIISAGSINSPQLLMLSGIGPKSDLGGKGIEVIQDLPVGKYMTDQISFRDLHLTSNYAETPLSTKELVRRYLQGNPSLRQRSVAYFNSRNWGSPFPNVELAFAPPLPTELKFPNYDNSNGQTRQFKSKINESTDWLLQISLLHPKSTGTLKLRSKNPNDFPMIDIGIFDEKEDLEDMYRAIEVALGLANTPTGKKYNLTLNMNFSPCPNKKLQENPREYWFCILRHLALPAYNLASTVKMGPSTDPFSCVDHKLKVYGVNRLRVIDESIVPSTVTGHINAQAFLIGEKGADLVKIDQV